MILATKSAIATIHLSGWQRSWLYSRGLATILILVGSLGASVAQADLDDLERRTSWQPASRESVQTRLDVVLADTEAAAEVAGNARRIFENSEDGIHSQALLDHFVAAIAEVDDRVQAVRSVCYAARRPATPPSFPWLFGSDVHPAIRSDTRLLYGRWLTQHAYYDEALEHLRDLELEDVAVPSVLLFYRGVANHRLLHKEACVVDLDRLLENAELIPDRYASVSRLMLADIRPLKEDSLNEVARLMEDIQRRLQLGRAGTRVRSEEDEVIAKLDKMIEAIEQQQQQQQQGGAGAGQGQQSNAPAEQSGNLPGRGPGDVDPRPIGDKSGWGNLPPKERQEALQQISKDLPAHFREVIEEYFRKLANDSEN